MAGQPPYKPFENDRLQWVREKSEVGGPALAGVGQEDFNLRRPALLLFLSAKDTENCCAANYERFIFRDQKVVRLSKKEFVTVRLNRDTAKPEVLERFGVTKAKPAIRVVETEGLVFARFDACTNSQDVLKAMVACLRASAKKAKTTRKLLERFEAVDAALGQQAYRQAGVLLRKILRIKGGVAAGHVRAQRLLSEIAATGEGLFSDAQAIAEPRDRFDALMHLRHEFWDFEELVTRIRPTIRELEQAPETAEIIHDHKAAMLLSEAQDLIERGKEAKGRTILRKICREFEGTPTAAKAQELLDR